MAREMAREMVREKVKKDKETGVTEVAVIKDLRIKVSYNTFRAVLGPSKGVVLNTSGIIFLLIFDLT